MTYLRLAYDDADSTSEMSSDCLVAERNLHLPMQTVSALVGQGPLSDDPLLTTAPEHTSVVVPDSLVALAAELHLHFD